MSCCRPEDKEGIPMEAATSSERESTEPLYPVFGNWVPTGLPPRPVELIWRRPSPLRKAGKPPKVIPSPEGETPSEPELR